MYYITYFNRPRSLQRWYRAHPKTTLFATGAMFIQLGWMWHKILREDKSALNKRWVNVSDQVDAEIAADPIGWYIRCGLTPRTHEEKVAFRQNFPQFGLCSDEETDVLFAVRTTQ